MANTADTRYVRTEEAIRGAFMQLVATKPATEVKVSAICRRAGISRNAFYLHHASGAALYSALVGELVADIRAESLASAERFTSSGDVDYALSHAIMNAFAKREELLRALLPSDDGALAKQLAEGLENAYIEAALLVGKRGGTLEHRMNCAFAAWAHIGFITRWIAATDRPVAESFPLFEKLQAGLTESASVYLAER